MQGDPETSDPVGQGGEWGFIAYLHCLMAEMLFRCKQAFPREEKCLLDHLPPFGTSCSPSFSPSLRVVSSLLKREVNRTGCWMKVCNGWNRCSHLVTMRNSLMRTIWHGEHKDKNNLGF
jgi:hypothetical protein